MNKEKKNKYLYKCNNTIDSYDYKKMAKYFPKRMYWVFVLYGTIYNVIGTALITIILQNILITLIFFLSFQIFLMILYYARLEHYSEKVFVKRKEKGIMDVNFETEFYENYFIRKGETTSLKVNYNDIGKCIETDDYFYFEIPKRNAIVILQKSVCELDLISYIRDKFDNLENHIGDSSNFKGVKKHHNPIFVRNFMIVLFIHTIISVFLADISVILVNSISPKYGSSFIKNMWVFWAFLPIPILSIILGFKYKNVGYRCKKNIIAGFILGFILFIFGSYGLYPTYNVDYKKIYDYKDVIDVKIPSNGYLEIRHYNKYFDDDKENYTIIDVYYGKEHVKDLVKSIEESNNWILSKKIKSELKALIPINLKPDYDAYYSIYNKTTNEYNKLPEESGTYKIYTMKYDKSSKHLEIYKFDYMYRN